jgi:hypothetical protein
MLAMGRAAYPPRGSSSARSLCGGVNVNALDDFVSCFGGWDRWRFRTSGAVAGSSFGECGPYRLGLEIYLIIKMSDPKDDPKSSEWRPYAFARDQWHCRICGDRFLYSEMVRKHIASEHNETMPPTMYEYFRGAVWHRKKLP